MDQTFTGVGLAVRAKTELGDATAPATWGWEDGTITEAEGAVLGTRDAGDANSGVTLPSEVRIQVEKADVGFTKQAGTFTRSDIQNLAIAIELKGNGATATPSAGEGQPAAGIDALWQMAGLEGANGDQAAGYKYTPRADTKYGDIGLWFSDLRYILKDVIVESAEIVSTPGGISVVTFNLAVGSVDDFDDGITFPTFSYGTQATLSAPTVQSATNTFGDVRGFETLTVTIANTIEEIGDSNQSTGVRKVQADRTITASATVFSTTADSDQDRANVVGGTPTADWTFQIGSIAGAGETLNAYEVNLNNFLNTSYKANRRGSVLVAEIEGYCTGLTAGSEFEIEFD